MKNFGVKPYLFPMPAAFGRMHSGAGLMRK